MTNSKETLTAGGITQTYEEWSRETGIHRETIRSRIRRGIPADKALSAPLYFASPLTDLPEYISWKGMISRCCYRGDPRFSAYGGRGIKVCARWLPPMKVGLANFIEDMKKKPFPEASIDRINNNGNYEPTNCRWATREQQNSSRRDLRMLTLDGETAHVAEWSRRRGIPSDTIRSRLRNGWSDVDALTVPVKTQFQRFRK